MSAMVQCLYCGEPCDRSELVSDGARCPQCVNEECEGCHEEFSHHELDEGLCEDCQNPTCVQCEGTGMPSTGPPDVGSCSVCGGSGVLKRAREDRWDGE